MSDLIKISRDKTNCYDIQVGWLHFYLQSGLVKPTDLYKRDGSTEWLPVQDLVIEARAKHEGALKTAGIPMPKDWAEDYYQEAFHLENYFEDGEEPDEEQIGQLHYKAAVLGHPSSQCSVGYEYYKGLGRPKSIQAAIMWFTKAAYQGEDSAQSHLAEIASRGVGVPLDEIEAWAWYDIVATAKHSSVASEQRDRIGKRLSRNQIQGAQARRDELLKEIARRQDIVRQYNSL